MDEDDTATCKTFTQSEIEELKVDENNIVLEKVHLNPSELRTNYDYARSIFKQIKAENPDLSDEQIRYKIIELGHRGCNDLLQGYPILYSNATSSVPTVQDDLIYRLIESMEHISAGSREHVSALQDTHRQSIQEYYLGQTKEDGGKAKAAATTGAVSDTGCGGGDCEVGE